jgi:predicted DCC family thiol-disulfide oxidoreductase YuxK
MTGVEGGASPSKGPTDGPDRPLDPADVPRDRPILLFDGVCNLCSGLVRFVIERDPDARFRFAALQSPAGRALLAKFGFDSDDFDTMVLVDGDDYYTRSTAALRTVAELDGPVSWLAAARFVPRPLRDLGYDLVASTRYTVFGRTDRCMRPAPELEDRFLDGGVTA